MTQNEEGGLVQCDPARVLVVDDEVVIANLFRSILSYSFADVKIDSACNGLEAVKAFRESHHAVLLMDLRMPEMDGRQAFFAIRAFCQEQHWQEPAVVFCTGFPPPRCLDEILEDGSPHCFLLKPVSSEIIVEAVRARLPG